MMTRAILASCLWHFLPLLLHSRQISNGSCTRFPAFAEATAVKARICSQLISCNFTNFWLRNNFYRDNAPVHTRIFVTVDKLVVPIKHVPQHSQCSQSCVPRSRDTASRPGCVGIHDLPILPNRQRS